MRFKNGEKVLVSRGWSTDMEDLVLRVQSNPGVPVADLVRECELAALACLSVSSGWFVKDNEEYKQLRAAREAASKPRYKQGQEIAARGFVHQVRGDGLLQIQFPSGAYVNLDPKDIKPVEEEE